MDQPPRKKGRPRFIVTETFLEQGRLAKQRSNTAYRRGIAPGTDTLPEDPVQEAVLSTCPTSKSCVHDRVLKARAAHTHIVFWLSDTDKLKTTEDIDES